MNLFFKRKKSLLLYLFLFIIIFIATFFVTYVFLPVNCDEVWIYGFVHNIYRGMIIYRDFNVITTPLYYFVGSCFLRIFGDYMISLAIFNSILAALMFLMLFNSIKFKAFIVLPTILVLYPNGYNLLALFLLIVILFLVDKKKDDDFYVAFLLGLLFITKQNLGIFLLIPYLYYSKKKIKGFIVFLIPFALVCVYLVYNNAFYNFIDYCFLGLFDFGVNNNYCNYFVFFSEIIIVFFLMKYFFESKFKDKSIFYILMFQFMLYPWCNLEHFFVALFPVLFYFLKKINNMYFLIIITFFVYYTDFSFFVSKDFDISLNDNVFYLKNVDDLPILTDVIHNYLDDEDNYYFTGYYGYVYKLYFKDTITKYDLWNEGNMGYKGLDRSIYEIDTFCKEEKCVFVADVFSDPSINKQAQNGKFYNYVIDNYNLIDKYKYFHIYSN